MSVLKIKWYLGLRLHLTLFDKYKFIWIERFLICIQKIADETSVGEGVLKCLGQADAPSKT